MVAREVIVTIDDALRRLVWTVVGGRMTHHNGVAEVFPDGQGTRFVWTADLLPGALAPAIDGMMSQAMPIIKATVERAEAERERS